ncbi:hypothetical protein LINPERPRIM_LOCUS14698, partial [Linum perenne]
QLYHCQTQFQRSNLKFLSTPNCSLIIADHPPQSTLVRNRRPVATSLPSHPPIQTSLPPRRPFRASLSSRRPVPNTHPDRSSIASASPDLSSIIQLRKSTLVQVVSHVIASEQRLEDSKKGIEELEKKLVGLQPDIRKLNDELAAGDGKIYCAGRRGKVYFFLLLAFHYLFGLFLFTLPLMFKLFLLVVYSNG